MSNRSEGSSFELGYLCTRVLLRKAETWWDDESENSTEEIHVSTKGQLDSFKEKNLVTDGEERLTRFKSVV